jgi:hypothetical protein
MQEMMRLSVLNVLLFTLGIGLNSFQSHAQDVKVRSGFIQDSLRLGDAVEYYLVAEYPRELNLLFPDSTFSFDPFEFKSKYYSPTHTQGSESYDSVVYSLLSFDVSEVQYLALPVYVVNERDCTRYAIQPDSIFLKSMLTEPVPDSIQAQDLPLKTNTVYERVMQLLNYPLLLIVLGVLLIAAVLVWIIFGKRIRKYFTIKRLKKNHILFENSFINILNQLKEHFEANQTEEAVSLWKKYLEQLERKPFTKLTTRETLALEKDESLGKSLRSVDQAIYGHSTSVENALLHLQQIAYERTSKKIEEVKNG